MDSFGRLIGIILAGVLLLLYPLQYLSYNQNLITKNQIHSITKEFIEEVMYNGSLTIAMYERYSKIINSSDYEFDLIHSKALVAYKEGKSEGKNQYSSGNKDLGYKKLGNIIVDKKRSNISSEDKSTNYKKSVVNEGNNVSSSNLLHMGMKSSSYQVRQILPTTSHIHTTDCFSEQVVKHIHQGNTNSGGGCYGLPTTSQTLCGSYAYYTSEMWTWTCSSCGYSPTYIAGYNGQTLHYSSYSLCSGSMSVTSIQNEFRCSSCSSSKSNPTSQCTNRITRTSYSRNCGKNEGGFYLGDTLKSPICHEIITSITPTRITQTVIQGEPIITTVNASYLDGHSKVINLGSNYSGSVGNEVVTLTFTGLIRNGKTRGNLTTTITITTLPNRIPVELLITPSSTIVNNGEEANYEVRIKYDNEEEEVTSNYIKTGFTKGAGIKTVVFTYKEENITLTKSVIIEVKRNTKICPYGHVYELDDFDSDLGCDQCGKELLNIRVSPNYITLVQGEELNLILTAYYKNGHTKLISTGWLSNYDKNRLGEQLVLVTYEDKECLVHVTTVSRDEVCSICNTKYSKEKEEDSCPVCKEFVLRIEASPSEQIISLGDPIEIMVNVFYRDGSSEYIDEWTSNYNAYKTGEQNVTVYYKDVLTTVTVVVQSDSLLSCEICNTTYSRITYPNGCPICSNIVERMEAKLKGGANKVQLYSEVNVDIILIYRDGHREYGKEAYQIENYESNKLGYQNITILYKEHTFLLEILVVNTLNTTKCINGHTYYLNEDGSDPGCNRCKEGELSIYQEYVQCIYTNEIMNQLYRNGIYYFDPGDYVSIAVKMKDSSIYHKINFFSKDKLYSKYTYGGMIIGKYI